MEANSGGHVRLGAASVVGSPLLGQVQLPVHQRPTLRTGIGEEDPDLAVLDATGGAGLLALHPGRLVALLEEPGLIDHQHATRVAQVLHDVVAHLIAQPIGIPAGGGEQPLHPIRAGLPSMLSQLPAVLACHIAKQHLQEPGDPVADLRAGEPELIRSNNRSNWAAQPSTSASI